MPYGNFYYGKDGFKYKKWNGGGARRNPPLGLLNCGSHDVNNTYVPGSGVGASSIATRRAKLNHATSCTPQYPCNKSFSKLGLFARGGSNKIAALNWLLPTPGMPMSFKV
uniref:Uncharacterized protein n=1 Tax=viral metagenome TaxID=1070528 RepID=A0A6C0AZI4_9ZZZZ